MIRRKVKMIGLCCNEKKIMENFNLFINLFGYLFSYM